MPIVQELSRNQVLEGLDESIRREIPVAVTCQIDSEWKNLRSRMLQRTAQGLWLEYPACGEDPAVEIAPGTKLGLSFKLKHHKHIFNAIVEEVGQTESPDGRPTRAICLPVPYRVHRVQRRAYQRVDVPRNRSVLGTFWRGGLSAAAQANQLGLVWEAWLTNISAGGFQVRLSGRSAPDLEVGDLVGVRIDLGQDYRDVLVNAQFRQQHEDNRGVAYQGFQFIGLHESTRGREMLRRIAGIVCEFQRIEGRRHDNVA